MTKKILLLFITLIAICGCKSDSMFLEDINFSDGDYTLYVRHKTLGEFIILDEDALKKNKEDIHINYSFVNYLPGEGDRRFGLRLFKNNKLVKSKIGGAFSTFKIGDLKKYATPIVNNRFSGIKEEISQKIDSLRKLKKVYITQEPKFFEDGYEFSFRISFPSVPVPIKRTRDSLNRETRTITNDFDETIMANEIKQRILDLASPVTNFELSVSSGTLSNSYLMDYSGEQGKYLRNIENKIVYIDDFMFYNFTAYIRAKEGTAKKLMTLDYATCLTDEQRLQQALLAKMKEKVLQSKTPELDVEKGVVRLSDYKNTIGSSKLYEQEYSIAWLEVQE